jgi:hypothetical protein
MSHFQLQFGYRTDDKAKSDIARDDEGPIYISDDDGPVHTPSDNGPAYILDDDLKPSAQKTVYEDSKLKDERTMSRELACANIVKRKGDQDRKSAPVTLPLDTEDHKQPRRTEQKQEEEEAEDNFGQVEPATTQTSLPEEGTLWRDRSFSR